MIAHGALHILISHPSFTLSVCPCTVSGTCMILSDHFVQNLSVMMCAQSHFCQREVRLLQKDFVCNFFVCISCTCIMYHTLLFPLCYLTSKQLTLGSLVAAATLLNSLVAAATLTAVQQQTCIRMCYTLRADVCTFLHVVTINYYVPQSSLRNDRK